VTVSKWYPYGIKITHSSGIDVALPDCKSIADGKRRAISILKHRLQKVQSSANAEFVYELPDEVQYPDELMNYRKKI